VIVPTILIAAGPLSMLVGTAPDFCTADGKDDVNVEFLLFTRLAPYTTSEKCDITHRSSVLWTDQVRI
jgi:hypothetical protein